MEEEIAHHEEERRFAQWMRNPLSNNTADKGDFWAVWQAAERLFPARLTRDFLHGMSGGALRAGSCPLFQSDLLCWLVPGLAWCGVQAELLPLRGDTSEWLPLLRGQIRRHIAVPVFAFAGLAEPPVPTELPPKSILASTPRTSSRKVYRKQDFPEHDVLELPPADAALDQQSLVTAIDMQTHSPMLSDVQGISRAIRLEELPAVYSHALILRRAHARHSRATQIPAALRQWAAFSCAYPERVLTTDSADASTRELAAQFWRGLAGRERSPAATRLRHLADLFAAAVRPSDLSTAFNLIYEAACAAFALPQEVEAALLAPHHIILTEWERRELIYLCRAGTRDLKIFAAHRLSYEREHADVRSALQQLRYDADAWVRKVAGGEKIQDRR